MIQNQNHQEFETSPPNVPLFLHLQCSCDVRLDKVVLCFFHQRLEWIPRNIKFSAWGLPPSLSLSVYLSLPPSLSHSHTLSLPLSLIAPRVKILQKIGIFDALRIFDAFTPKTCSNSSSHIFKMGNNLHPKRV